MSDVSHSKPLADTLAVMATLTPAQHALLERISHHSAPVTVAELAREAGVHVSSVRETLEGLCALNLVERQQLPAQGRGRPALGYTTATPTDPTFAAQMLHHLTASLLLWVRESVAAPADAVRDIGARWADSALSTMGVPDHAGAAKKAGANFSIIAHLSKVRLFLNALGFASQPHPHDSMAIVLTACPFLDEDTLDELGLELRRGIVERIFERTAQGVASWSLETDPSDPVRLTIFLRSLDETNPGEDSVTLHFFGGAADVAGAYMRELPFAQVPETLGELIESLSGEEPQLSDILRMSSYLVNERSASLSTALEAGSRIDVLPPFAGN